MIRDTRPILSALLRNKTGAFLVAVQIALTLALLVNAVYIVKSRIDRINRPTGIDDQNVFVVATQGYTSRFDYTSTVRTDLDYLRGLHGVVAATISNSIPLSGGGSADQISPHPGDKSNLIPPNTFETDEEGFNALGVKLIAGRAFTKEDVLPPMADEKTGTPVPNIIVSQPLAAALFPGENALGKRVYEEGSQNSSTIIGITAPVLGSWPLSLSQADKIMFYPRMPKKYGFVYLVRTQPGQRDSLMRTAEEHLSSSNPDRVVDFVQPLSLFKDRTYAGDKSVSVFLSIVTVMLISLTCLGIFALVTFNVSTRTKQIGTRRAVGARRVDIVRYFMIENGLITTSGVVVGCLLALIIGYQLSERLSMPRLDLYFLVGGIVVLWSLGQLAAWYPSRKASYVPPSVATRTV